MNSDSLDRREEGHHLQRLVSFLSFKLDDAPASGVEREAERAEFQRRMERKQINNRRNANKNRKRDRMPI